MRYTGPPPRWNVASVECLDVPEAGRQARTGPTRGVRRRRGKVRKAAASGCTCSFSGARRSATT
jgi:hypothetical protein